MYSKKCIKKEIMRVTTAFLILLAFFPSIVLAEEAIPSGNNETGIKFLDISFNEALMQAKSNEKFIFIDCYTSWCGPCKVMMNTVFKESTIGNFMNPRFVNIKLNMEEEGDGQLVYSKFKITSFPTYLILKSDGTIIGKFEGSCSAADFTKRVTRVLESNAKSL